MKRLLSLGARAPRRASAPLHRRLFASEAPAVPKSERDREFLAALQVFYRTEGHFTVPYEFVVPTPTSDVDTEAFPWPKETWGMDLGNRLRLFTRGRCSPFKCALLRTVGFPFEDWKTYVWEMQIIPSLKVFQELEGHLFVRQSFQVPVGDDRWPRAAWGVKLGSQCQLLRRDAEDGLLEHRKQQLDAMGFVWSDAQWKWKMQFLTAMKHYRNLYGHCSVHHTFKVPTNDPFWPEVNWGYRLGHAVAKVKANLEEHAMTPRAMADLRELNFFEDGLSLEIWREALLPSLELYPSLFGDTFIPQDFVVPSQAPWPERGWGMKLGYIVETINSRHIFKDEIQNDKQKLKELGYAWESLFGKWAKELLPALRLYKAKYHHCDVPSWWVVPSNDESWPKALRGYHLGKQVVRVRRNGRGSTDVADVLAELEALGFKFNAFESYFVDRVLPALEVYAEIYGDTHVPQGFIVPSESTWPRPSWGTKLGHTVRNIRNRHQHAQQVEMYRERLEEVGFVWSIYKSTAATKRDIVDPSVEAYKEINGEDAEVPRNFTVPADDSRYPEVAKGFELGAWIAQYNKRTTGLLPFQTQEGKKKAVTANDKLRHAQARAQGKLTLHAEQYWKDVLLSSFRAYAEQHVSCEDMDGSFIVPTEEPYPQSAWGLNLGLRLRHVRHGVRYAREIAKYKDELFELGVLRDGDGIPMELNDGEYADREGDFDNDGNDFEEEDFDVDEDFEYEAEESDEDEQRSKAHLN
ncbi:hypothetical protein JG687_00003743 [Phytophthora cactorum]|uniref:Helicase-associated domain-containing protein n=1 Tax=Phytophthora cactorum TaxID=29920 RepID=A0A329SLA1_9STRA|nr:hypothetical protein Pcac1_g14517 [Phytophthora cactorum]KAG2839727.1 hypothetical protein PC112_g4005 [Phytophthora cactorum]KAG2865283.1 hypothetical protein PC113_g3830 [Phytophthora cactorum]KAG2924986.1 hypothetical protein PC114_g4284 [Phytophthora cactorum]KAG2939286.1 hypothetical protein PC115_g3175 [Phytophthora cactorum]